MIEQHRPRTRLVGVSQTTFGLVVVVTISIGHVRIRARPESCVFSSAEAAVQRLQQFPTFLALNPGRKSQEPRSCAIREETAAEHVEPVHARGEQAVLRKARLAVRQRAHRDACAALDLPDLEHTDRDVAPGLDQLPLILAQPAAASPQEAVGEPAVGQHQIDAEQCGMLVAAGPVD